MDYEKATSWLRRRVTDLVTQLLDCTTVTRKRWETDYDDSLASYT
jgi:hypothetical protein